MHHPLPPAPLYILRGTGQKHPGVPPDKQNILQNALKKFLSLIPSCRRSINEHSLRKPKHKTLFSPSWASNVWINEVHCEQNKQKIYEVIIIRKLKVKTKEFTSCCICDLLIDMEGMAYVLTQALFRQPRHEFHWKENTIRQKHAERGRLYFLINTEQKRMVEVLFNSGGMQNTHMPHTVHL